MARSYRLTLPPDIPESRFWSILLYDRQTRSMLQTDQPMPRLGSQPGTLETNQDGSIDIYFGPTAPEGKESNWLQTVPGKGWWTILRLYNPLQAFFDKTWRPARDRTGLTEVARSTPTRPGGQMSITEVHHPNATIPDSVEVPRVGTLQYELGFPTPETSQKLFDEMDFQRAVQAYLWGYPAVSFESIRVTAKQDLGIDFNDLGIADNFVDPEVRLAHRERHDDLRLRQHRRRPGSGRDRHPTRGHRRPAGRLLAALARRRRPARTRRAATAASSSCSRPATTARFRRPATT